MSTKTVELPPALDFLPRSPVEIWERWLGWRWPHFDVMETTAAATLLGTKFVKVRVGWDGSRRAEAQYHMTLFTLTEETDSPERTVAALRDDQPAGFVLHHVMTRRPSRLAATPPDPRAATLTQQITAAMAVRARFMSLRNDPRVSPSALDATKKNVTEQLGVARTATEAAITDGLVRRLHFTLRPLAVIKPSMLEDWILYRFLLDLRRQLLLEPEPITWRPDGVAVCDTCAMVFRPRRRRTAVHCGFCSGRDLRTEVFGERPLVHGQLQTFRAPRLQGNVIVGWKTASMGCCKECGEVFIAQRSDAEACEICSPKLRQRRFRARRRAPE